MRKGPLCMQTDVIIWSIYLVAIFYKMNIYILELKIYLIIMREIIGVCAMHNNIMATTTPELERSYYKHLFFLRQEYLL